MFGLILAPDLELRGEAVLATSLFHLVSPVLFVGGWLLSGPRRQGDLRMSVLAFVWPAPWCIFTFVRGAITGWYPYPFLDVRQHGIGSALLGAAAVLGYAIVLTLIVLLFDRGAPAIGSSPEPTGGKLTSDDA